MKPRAAAIAYIAPTHDQAGPLSDRLIEYGRRRGYGLLAIFLQWPAVRHLLEAKTVGLIVHPPGDYGTTTAEACDPDASTDEITQPLSRPAALNREATAARYEVAAGVTRAVIYLPPGSAVDGPFAQLCLAHVEARGYELVGIVHTRAEIGQMFRNGIAAVAVLARREHWDPLWTPRIEVAGEDPDDVTPRPTPKSARNEKNAGRNRDRRPRVLG